MDYGLGVMAALLGVQALLAWEHRQLFARDQGELSHLWDAVAGFVCFGVGLRTLYFVLDWELDAHSNVFWTVVCFASLVVGLVTAVRKRRMPTSELLAATVLVLELAAVWARFEEGAWSLSAAPFRMLLVAPAVLALWAYFGGSIGTLFFGGGRKDPHLGYEVLIAKRYLLSRASPVLSTVTTISIIGVALGVWLVCVSLGILSGFESDLRRKIIGAHGHVVVQTPDQAPFSEDDPVLLKLDETEGVVALSRFLSGETAIASRSNYSGALVFGIEPDAAAEALSLFSRLDGSLEPLREEGRASVTEGDPRAEENVPSLTAFAAPAPTPSIVIGIEMAKALGVQVGDRVRLISPMVQVLTPLGMVPRTMSFEIQGIFDSKMYEYDARFAYISLPAARRFFRAADDAINGIHVRTDDAELSENVGQAVAARLGRRYEALDWKRRNQTLFAALKLERVVAFVVLVFIILVASFAVVNTLTMSVLEKRREIAILKTMGARAVGMMKVFLAQGMVVGSIGSVLGALAAGLTVWFLKRFGFWIPGEVYYIEALPVHLEVRDVLIVTLAALLIVWDFAVFPALRGARLDVVEGLRDG